MASSSSGRDQPRPDGGSVARIVVCWKWGARDGDRRGEFDDDPRWSGVSAADQAALEVALRIAEAGGRAAPSVAVVCLGPAPADTALRDALAVGAHDVLRIDADPGLDSRVVATAIAPHLTDADLVLCGDCSIDRGTGAVPAFLAAQLDAAQALGLLAVEPGSTDRGLRVTRRLDGGRREILDVTMPAVLSVEGSVARLRRASMAAVLAARRAPVPTVAGPTDATPEYEVHPYRPRTHLVPGPTGDARGRIRQLIDPGGGGTRAVPVALDPPDAAARIVARLSAWGYLSPHGEEGLRTDAAR